MEEQLAQLETKVEAKVKATRKPEKSQADPQPPAPGTLSLGDKVFIPQFNTVGEVVGVQNKQVEVQLGAFRSTVPLTGVVLREKAAPRELESSYSSVKVPTVEVAGDGIGFTGASDRRGAATLGPIFRSGFFGPAALGAHYSR